MLEKTLNILKDIPAGSDGVAGQPNFDEAEIDQLAALLNRLIYAPRDIRRRIEERGVSITRADFYSQIPTIAELEDSLTRPTQQFDYPFKDTEFLKSLLEDLTEFSAEFNPPSKSPASTQYGWDMGAFSYSDAMAYYSIVRKFKPQTIIELGCGASTLIAQEALAANGGGRHICVEPYPSDMIKSLQGIELHQQKAQLLQIEFFNDNLNDGDILFIDTTHTVKHDSDCIHLYLRLLPEIKRNIIVHVHDVFLPFPFHVGNQIKSQCFWTEQYLLLAYMIDNPRVKTLFGSNYHNHQNPALLSRFMHGRHSAGGASIWFHQYRRV